jgi:hypothetical protein
MYANLYTFEPWNSCNSRHRPQMQMCGPPPSLLCIIVCRCPLPSWHLPSSGSSSTAVGDINCSVGGRCGRQCVEQSGNQWAQASAGRKHKRRVCTLPRKHQHFCTLPQPAQTYRTCGRAPYCDHCLPSGTTLGRPLSTG